MGLDVLTKIFSLTALHTMVFPLSSAASLTSSYNVYLGAFKTDDTVRGVTCFLPTSPSCTFTRPHMP